MSKAGKLKLSTSKSFFERLSNNSSKLNNQGSRNDFIVNIERLYNHGTANKV